MEITGISQGAAGSAPGGGASRQEASVRKTQSQDRFEPSAALSSLYRPAQPKRSTIWDLLSPKEEKKDTLTEAAEARKLCAKIAARIRKGDKVPQKDMRYLFKTDPHLYQMTMIMRREKEDPKKWDSLLKGDEGQRAREATASPEAAAPAPLAGPSSGGAPSGGGASGGGSASGGSASGGGAAQ